MRHFADRVPLVAQERLGSFHRWIGPDAERWEALSRASLRGARERLADRELPGAERLRRYRRELERAAGYLESELRTDPGRSETWVNLATLRWELDSGSGAGAQDAFLERLRDVARHTKRRPHTQLRLAQLMARLGETEDASRAFRVALHQRPDLAGTAVERLRSRGVPPERMLAYLPRDAAVLRALRPVYLRSGREPEFLQLLEEGMDRFDTSDRLSILPAYGFSSLAQSRQDPLVLRLEALSFESSPDDAVRREWLALGYSAQGSHERALQTIGEACPAHPRPPACLESEGKIAQAAGEPERALAAFDRAGRWLARHTQDRVALSRLQYRRGRVHEDRLRFDRARSAYARALELDPENGAASSRVRFLEQAARKE